MADNMGKVLTLGLMETNTQVLSRMADNMDKALLLGLMEIDT